jgi:sirohydrochlorin ferrochelatase
MTAAPCFRPAEAILVAHGAPAAPETQEAAMADLAAAVERVAPRWRVRAATLAMPGALAAAVAAAGPGALVYPMFMSAGWFSTVELPRRLRAAGATDWRAATPFGLDPGLPALGARMLADAARGAGFDLRAATLVLAAHGAPEHRGPAAAARAAAEAIGRAAGVAAVRACFVDEDPRLVEGLTVEGPAICLPFFATAAGHATGDLPEAVEAADFRWPVTAPIGCDPGAPALIAAALGRAAAAAA